MNPKTGIQNPLTAICLLLLMLFYAAFSSHAQLSPGDIAFTGYNSDNPDQFSFIATKEIPGGEVIYFTDRGYSDEIPGWINTSEGVKKYTSPANGLEQGDIIVINSDGGWHITQGAGSFEDIAGAGSFSLAGGGDQIFAFQTNDPEYYPQKFIAGIHYNINSLTNESNWDNIGTTGETSESDLPDELTNGESAIWVYGTYNTSGNDFTRDNAKYNNTITVGEQNVILSNTNNHLNWELDNNIYYTLGYPATTATAASGNWNEVATWDIGIPGKITDVTVGHSLTAPADCEVQNASLTAGAQLTVNSGMEFTCQSLTLESDAGQSASFINNGTFTGEVTYKRFLSGGRWYLVSSPVSGQNISGFLTDENNNIPQNGTDRGMMDYSTASDSWNDYFTNATGGTLEPGKGYGARRETDGSLVFTGSLVSTQVDVAVSESGNAWNLIGNPYPAAINATETADAENNFLTINSEYLDPSFMALYLWDEAEGYSTGGYKIINNAESGSDKLLQDYLQGAQGFFVKIKTGISQLTFTPEMQSHTPDTPFKSGDTPWPEIQVSVQSGGKTAGTTFLFHKSMSRGLDVGYDAGAFKNQSGLALYSKLMEDNGVDFSLQCLPADIEQTLAIPLVIEAGEYEQLTFSIKKYAWPGEIETGIKDLYTNSVVILPTENDEYETITTSNLTNRFFLMVGKSLKTGIEQRSSGFSIFQDIPSEKIIVNGASGKNSRVSVFDLTGKKVKDFRLSEKMIQELDFSGFKSGVYIVRFRSDQGVTVRKINWIK